MRIWSIGSGGMLGRDLVRKWTEDEVVPATSRDADIRGIKEVRQLVAQAHPDWIVLTAAYTDVDGSEQNSELAFAVNGEGTKNVACVPQERGAKLSYVSTDYLFDGNPSHRARSPDCTAKRLWPVESSQQKGLSRKSQCLVHCAYFLAFWHFRDLHPGESPRLTERIHESQVF